jgi:glucose/mannose-6-phosphate isomerase
MNLDNTSQFHELDPQDMLSHIDGLPDQIENAWKLGFELELPDWKNIRNVLISGMGGSAIGSDLLCAYVAPFGRVPVVVSRDYGLPAWAEGPATLVVASSHSGNTEETLQTYNEALEAGCKCLALTTGGRLAQVASQAGMPQWIFQHTGQPRTAVGFSFTLLMLALNRLDLLPDPTDELKSAIKAMRDQQKRLYADNPTQQNPAKQLSMELFGRWVVVFGAGALAPVARRWKTQINELAKAWAQFEFLPEADHNTLAGTLEPKERLSNLTAFFLVSSSDHPRNQLRSHLTRQAFVEQGIQSDLIEIKGDQTLSNMWTALHLGDYIAYYLAIAYEVDPTPVNALSALKEALRSVE